MFERLQIEFEIYLERMQEEPAIPRSMKTQVVTYIGDSNNDHSKIQTEERPPSDSTVPNQTIIAKGSSNDILNSMTSTSRLVESPLEAPQLLGPASKQQNERDANTSRNKFRNDPSETHCQTLMMDEQMGSVKARLLPSHYQTAELTDIADIDANTEEESGTVPTSPRCKNILIMPMKTEVISVIKGVVSGQVTIPYVKDQDESHVDMQVIAEDLFTEIVNPSSVMQVESPHRRDYLRDQKVIKKPLQPKTFQVPIGTGNNPIDKSKSPARHEKLFPNSVSSNRAKHMKLTMQQHRPGFSPSQVDPAHLNLTTEQLFTVMNTNATPQEVLRSDLNAYIDQQEEAGGSVIASAATFCNKPLKARGKLRDNTHSVKRQFQVLINSGKESNKHQQVSGLKASITSGKDLRANNQNFNRVFVASFKTDMAETMLSPQTLIGLGRSQNSQSIASGSAGAWEGSPQLLQKRFSPNFDEIKQAQQLSKTTSHSHRSSSLGRQSVNMPAYDHRNTLYLVTQAQKPMVQEVTGVINIGSSNVMAAPGSQTSPISRPQLSQKAGIVTPKIVKTMAIIDAARADTEKATIALPARQSQEDMSVSSYNKIVADAKRKFCRENTIRLRNHANNMDLSEEDRSSLIIQESVTHGSHTLSGLVNWAPFAINGIQCDYSRNVTLQESCIYAGLSENSKFSPNHREARRGSMVKIQKFMPRSSQTTANEQYLQISPRNFNKQILLPTKRAKIKSGAATTRGWGRTGFKPAADVASRAKRETMRKLAGLCSQKQAQPAGQDVGSPGSKQKKKILLDAKIQPVTPDQGTFDVPPSTPAELQNPPNSTKTEIMIRKPQETQPDEPLGRTLNSNRGSQTLNTGTCGEETLLNSIHSNEKSNGNAAGGPSVHFLSGGMEFNSYMIQQTARSVRADPASAELSIMTEDGLPKMQNEMITTTVEKLPYAPKIVSSHDLEEFSLQLSLRRNSTIKKKKRQGTVRIEGLERVSLSIQQSSNLDAESSLYKTRLTPRELQQHNINQFPSSPSTARDKKQLTRQSIEAKLVAQHQKSSRESGHTLSPTSQLAVSIQRTHRNNLSQCTAQERRSNAGETVRPAEGITSSRELLDRRKKVFLRQVYTNMQRSGQRNQHYETISERLHVDIQNSYTRRKQTLDKKDWQFGIMQSKLKDGGTVQATLDYGLTEESMCATNGTLSQQEPNGTDYQITHPSALSKLQMSRSNQNLRLEDQSLFPANNSVITSFANQPQLSHADQKAVISNHSTSQQRKSELRSDQNNSTNSATNQFPIELKLSEVAKPKNLYQQNSIISAPIDDSMGSSCVSFNPLFKKLNAEHELKPRKREWKNDYYPNVLPLSPPVGHDENTKQIIGESPGSKAYLDHIKARLKLKSQGFTTRPRPSHFQNQSFNSLRGVATPRGVTPAGVGSGAPVSGGQIDDSTALSHTQVSLTTRSHLPSRDNQKRPKMMVLKQDQALSPQLPSEIESKIMSSLSGADSSMKPRGMRTTKHSLAPQDTPNFSALALTPRAQQPLPAPCIGSLDNLISNQQQLLQYQRNTCMAAAEQGKPTKVMSNFTINRARPSLFRPFQVQTIEVDSYVKASSVVQAIAKPGKQNQTMQVGRQGCQTAATRMHRRHMMQRTFSDEMQGNTICSETEAVPQIGQPFHQAIDMNRQVSERNKALRRKAFSFTKTVGRRDISQMAKNLDDLSKTTLARPTQQQIH